MGKKGGLMPPINHAIPDTARSNDTLDLVRDPTWRKGGTRQKWAGTTSRRQMMKHRKEDHRRFTNHKMDRRVKNHILQRNLDGADLRMPKSWGDIHCTDVDQRYAELDVNHDGLIDRGEFYSVDSKERTDHLDFI